MPTKRFQISVNPVRVSNTTATPVLVVYKLSKPNATQPNSKATSVGVRHCSHMFHPPPTTPLPQTFQPLLDQL